MNLERNRSTMH